MSTKISKEQKKATQDVRKLKAYYPTVDDLCKAIGVAKATYYVRLEKQNWKLPEIALINQLSSDPLPFE